MAVQEAPSPANSADRPTALITGGSNGIGRATAELFARNGYDVVVWGQNEGRLAEVDQIEGIVAADRVDVRNDDEVSLALSRTFADRRLDVLVQSAGAIGLHSFAEAETVDQVMADWKEMCEANLTGPIRVAKAALQYFRESGGSIVNISSESASNATGFSWAYTTAKAGLEGLTRALAVDLGPRGIRVNAIAPGFIAKTGMTGWIPEKTQKEHAKKNVPIRRIGTPEDVAATVLHLANAQYTTGQVLAVNGGTYFN
jgi:NAD(P)-dependent dehydrogenase (short-subunit alcohol dehydrogenase family)